MALVSDGAKMPTSKKKPPDTKRSERYACVFYMAQLVLLLALLVLKIWFGEPVLTLLFVYVLVTFVLLIILWHLDRNALSLSLKMLSGRMRSQE